MVNSDTGHWLVLEWVPDGPNTKKGAWIAMDEEYDTFDEAATTAVEYGATHQAGMRVVMTVDY